MFSTSCPDRRPRGRPLRLPLVLLALASGALPALAQAPPHQLHLTNGDRYTGQLVRISGPDWIFQTAGGELRIPATAVADLLSAAPLGLRLLDGRIVRASVHHAPVGLALTLSDGTRTIVTPLDIVAVGDGDGLEELRPVRETIFWPLTRHWSATGSLGFSDKTGNSRSRGLSIAFEAERKARHDRVLVSLGMVREAARTADTLPFAPTVEKYYGTLRAEVSASQDVFVFAETRQERDHFQDLHLGSVYNGGLGLQAARSAVVDLRLSSSLGARREQFVSGGAETTSIGQFGGILQLDLGPARVRWRLDWTPDLQAFRDYRVRSEASVTMALVGGLGFRIGLLNEHNSTPRPGVEPHDMLVTTTLTYTLGR